MESEGNKDYKADKFNRVDLKVRNSKQEVIIIEIQIEAVKNNPDKFPQDYMFELSGVEFADLPRQELRLKPSPKKACICWQQKQMQNKLV